MEQLGFIVTLVFLGLSAILYGCGILVVDRISLTVQLDHKIEQYYNWVLHYGSHEQKEAAKIAAQNRDLEHLQTLAGAEAAIH